jgi:hypothetical protein
LVALALLEDFCSPSAFGTDVELRFVLLENSRKSAVPHQSRKEPTTQTHDGGGRRRTILFPSPERLRYHATNEPQQPPPLWSVFNALSLLPATAAGRRQ